MHQLVNLPTRSQATRWIGEVLEAAVGDGRHVVCGFDFSFGYPAGYADLVARAFNVTGPSATLFDTVLELTDHLVTDTPTNANNRFEVANLINERTGYGLFWGHPRGRAFNALSPTKLLPAGLKPNPLSPLRRTDANLSVKSNWQLTGAGAVGSQVLMGLPALAALRRRVGDLRVWPFEPHELGRDGGVAVVAEVWPSLFATGHATHEVRDAWQVATTAKLLSELTPHAWASLFAPPSWDGLSSEQRALILGEEGWILGKS
jgi:precorrin-8X/cobalt-precorrin-8 methylmutase